MKIIFTLILSFVCYSAEEGCQDIVLEQCSKGSRCTKVENQKISSAEKCQQDCALLNELARLCESFSYSEDEVTFPIFHSYSNLTWLQPRLCRENRDLCSSRYAQCIVVQCRTGPQLASSPEFPMESTFSRVFLRITIALDSVEANAESPGYPTNCFWTMSKIVR